MSTQEVPGAELADVVVLYITKREAKFLLDRCNSALSVVKSNLREEAEKRPQGPEYKTKLAQARALNNLITKLKESVE